MTNLASFLLPALVLLPVLGGLICWFAGSAGEKNRSAALLGLRAAVSWLVPTVDLLLVILLLFIGLDGETSFTFAKVCGLGFALNEVGCRIAADQGAGQGPH